MKLGRPISGTVWRFAVQRSSGDDFIHGYELEFYEPATAKSFVGSSARATPAAQLNDEIIWRTRTGQALTARFLVLDGDAVLLSVKGSSMKMPLAGLSDESRSLAEKLGKAGKAAGR